MAVLPDDLQTPIELPELVTRVVSLVPSLTEALALSCPGVLVGATQWCTHPGELDVPRFGGTKNPDLPGIIGLRPDLVVVNEEENKPEHVQRLRAAGVSVWVTDIRTVQGALDSMGRLLEALRAPQRDWLQAACRAWEQACPVLTTNATQLEPSEAGGRRIRAAIPIWRRPWMYVGSDTYAGDVLARLGVDNVLAQHPQRYPRIALADLPPLDLAILPDEPYAFSADDGPEAFDAPAALVSGRHLTWYGPAMVQAPTVLSTQIRAAIPPEE
ncbi:helical backbone metal receptor [Gephyromycinifex aptenodytis]|uniref:helical backbone metal receptor n=1 Tax=Gephyromycinifex aptenodytis TaxID=2716227 RepID=UPI00144841F4|nr:helical backbone metal receptor [Gephyromycinifex aptenodytis]